MSTDKSSKSKDKKMNLPQHLQHINLHAAGIDVGSRSHFAAVPEGASEQPVREFSSFTDDLHRMALVARLRHHHRCHGVHRYLQDSCF